MAEQYNQRLADSIKEMLEHYDLKYGFQEEGGIFFMNLVTDDDCCIDSVNFLIKVYQSAIGIYCKSCKNADSRFKELAKFVNMANYGDNFGFFHFDMNDGELGYKVFLNCAEDDSLDLVRIPSIKVLGSSLFGAYHKLKMYVDGFMEVSNGADAAAMIRAIED